MINKELKLENIMNKHVNWGENLDGEHSVNMKPLFPHLIEAENKAISKAKEFTSKISKGFR